MIYDCLQHQLHRLCSLTASLPGIYSEQREHFAIFMYSKLGRPYSGQNNHLFKNNTIVLFFLPFFFHLKHWTHLHTIHSWTVLRKFRISTSNTAHTHNKKHNTRCNLSKQHDARNKCISLPVRTGIFSCPLVGSMGPADMRCGTGHANTQSHTINMQTWTHGMRACVLSLYLRRSEAEDAKISD